MHTFERRTGTTSLNRPRSVLLPIAIFIVVGCYPPRLPRTGLVLDARTDQPVPYATVDGNCARLGFLGEYGDPRVATTLADASGRYVLAFPPYWNCERIW